MIPATTARMVAKATAATTANSTVPPVEPAPPPRSSASSGTAVFPAAFDAAYRVGADQGGRAEAEHDRHQVEAADEPDRPDDGAAGGPRGRHGVEARQDVRQPGRAQHERQAEADEVEAGGPVPAVLEAGREEVPAVPAALGGGAAAAGRSRRGSASGRARSARSRPPISRTAFTIWIQVVARIPPNDT